MRGRYLAVVTLVALAVAAGCSTDVDRPPVTEPGSTETTAVVAPEPAVPVSPAPTEYAGEATATGGPARGPEARVGPCPGTASWNTQPEHSAATAPAGAALSDVRPGRHECFDRIVFDVAGPPELGYHLGYVPAVERQGSGKPIAVAGEADLRVDLGVPAPALFAGFGYRAEWSALREIRFAGSFEGQTTFAVGVTDERPFRLFVLPPADRGLSHVVVDIAH